MTSEEMKELHEIAKAEEEEFQRLVGEIILWENLNID